MSASPGAGAEGAGATRQLADTNRALEEANRRLSLLSLEDPRLASPTAATGDITMEREWSGLAAIRGRWRC